MIWPNRLGRPPPSRPASWQQQYRGYCKRDDIDREVQFDGADILPVGCRRIEVGKDTNRDGLFAIPAAIGLSAIVGGHCVHRKKASAIAR